MAARAISNQEGEWINVLLVDETSYSHINLDRTVANLVTS